MVFLALTHKGFEEAKIMSMSKKAPNWIGADILSPSECETFRRNGMNLTVFSQPQPLKDLPAIQDALNTIAEHHPDETVWVEQVT